MEQFSAPSSILVNRIDILDQCLPVVVRFTQWLPVIPVPEEQLIPAVRNDVVYHCCFPVSVFWNALGGILDKPTILPLDTLWTEISARMKAGMIDVMSGFMGERSTENMESLLRDLIDAVKGSNAEPETVPAVNVENMVMASDMDARPLSPRSAPRRASGSTGTATDGGDHYGALFSLEWCEL